MCRAAADDRALALAWRQRLSGGYIFPALDSQSFPISWFEACQEAQSFSRAFVEDAPLIIDQK